MMMVRRSGVANAWLMLTGACVAGCSLAPPPLAPPRPYPAGAVQVGAVDVQVIRDDTTVTYTNTTGSTLPAGTLWVNKAFGRPVEALGVGERASYNLYSFYNRFGEAFRAGGFFSTQVPLDVVMVQLEAERGSLAGHAPGALEPVGPVAGPSQTEDGASALPPAVLGFVVAQGEPDER